MLARGVASERGDEAGQQRGPHHPELGAERVRQRHARACLPLCEQGGIDEGEVHRFQTVARGEMIFGLHGPAQIEGQEQTGSRRGRG